MGINNKELFNLNDLRFEDIIDGLNKYFAEDETRVRVPRSFVEVKGDQKPIFYRFDAEMYLDKLIALLRTEHGIFYYPGMEAKYAKTERIPPLTERLMDEGALNSLKKLHKRVTGEEPEVDSHTLIADGILHGISNAISVKDAQIVELQTYMRKQGEELRILKTKCNRSNDEEIRNLTETNCKDIMDYIRQEASRNGFELPEENDGKPLTVEMAFRDLLELLKKRDNKHHKDLCDILEALGISRSHTLHLGIHELKTRAIQRASVVKSEHDIYLEQRDKATADYQALCEENQKLKDSLTMGRYGWLYEDVDHKSDINKLISDFCAKNDVTPPSPYFSDEESIEYLFSVVDLERHHRAAVGKQMVDDYEKDLLQFIYKEYKDRTHLSDETITYNPPSIRNTITLIIRYYDRNRDILDVLETKIKYIFDKYKTKFTVDDYVLNGDPTSRFMLDCIGSWIGSSTELKQECDFFDRRKTIQTKLGTIEKRLEELLKDVKEELP